MQSPLQQLYKTQIVLLGFGGTLLGAALMVIGGWPDWKSLSELIGGVVFTAGAIVVAYQYVGNKVADRLAAERTNKSVIAAAPAFVSSAVHAIADTPEEILGIVADDVLDRIIKNSLTARFHDRELASDTYADLYEQVVRTEERWRDVRVDVVLTPWENGPASGKGSFYVATVKWEFRVKPTNSIMRFACVSDLNEYRMLSRDPTTTETWYFQPVDGLDATAPDVFELLQFSVEGSTRPIRRTARRGTQLFAADVGETEGREVAVSYTYRSLVQRHGHLLHVDPARLSKGFAVRFSYAGCGIRFVNVMDNISGAQQPRIAELPASDPTPSVEVRYDGWVFPKAGVAFVWVLDEELEGRRRR